jgi:lipopolysaccharide transport system ATP-binding protein
MAETVIKIENLRKQYRLGTIGGGTLTADVQTWIAKLKGKENPNSKIGEENITTGEKFWALDGINLEVKKGEAVGIIGHNGAGKSTLLKILSRVTAPTEGTVKMKGRISSMLEVGTGFHPELTGRENIYMNGAILGMTKKEVDSKIDEIIEFSECRQFIDTPVKRYSSGMYVKLAFAVAAHLDAEIMVMDEVLAVGDMKFQKKCLGKMGDAANNEGKTVLYVSHNMSTIRQLCTRCIVLSHGKVIFDGDVEDGIAVYMEQDKGELAKYYDFTSTSRPSTDHGNILFVKNFEFLDKQYPIYKNTERVKFRFEYTSSENIEDLRVYYTVLYGDDTIAGTVQSKVFGDARKNQVMSAEFAFDVSNFAPGRYYFYLDIFSMNEYGTHLSYDHPMQKIFFEVSDDESVESIRWQPNYFGHIRLNELEIIK